MGDHGGITMMALHQTTGPTDEVYFSLESGACWYTVQLAEAINVQNIRCVPPPPPSTHQSRLHLPPFPCTEVKGPAPHPALLSSSHQLSLELQGLPAVH